MGRRITEREQVYAVIRIDENLDRGAEMQNCITVKEVVRDLDIAQAEVERLNGLNQGKQCRYFWQTTRLFPVGDSFGTHENDRAEGMEPE